MGFLGSPGSQAGEIRRPRGAQPVAVNIVDISPHHSAGRRFQLQVSECVETKTVTTTTRLTRKFPHVFVRDPTPLQRLDSKEYPLARKATPPELLEFSYTLPADAPDDDELADSADDTCVGDSIDSRPPWRSEIRSISDSTTTLFKPRLSTDVSDDHEPSRAACPSPEGHSQRLRRLRTRHTKLTRPMTTSMNVTDTSSATALLPQAHASTVVSRPLRGFGRSSTPNALSDKLRRSIVQSGGRVLDPEVGSATGGGRSFDAHRGTGDQPDGGNDGFLATPTASELAGTTSGRSSHRRSLHLDRLQTSPSDRALSLSRQGLRENAASPSGSDSLTTFSSTVATPPITDADATPFADADADESLRQSVRALNHRPAIDNVATQDASLPSPRLSPTLTASQPVVADPDEDGDSFRTALTDRGSSWNDDSQTKVKSEDADVDPLDEMDATSLDKFCSCAASSSQSPVTLDTQTLLEAFDSMKTEMKTFMMFQFLRRCPRTTLRVVADAVNPALKCDFLFQLPLELAYHVLSYLDCQTLCRAAQVSKHWRNIVDRNETVWKELFDHDGFTLAPGELAKAIAQGWGWQDPVGDTGYERDLGMHDRLTLSDFDLTRSLRQDTMPPKPRTSKRKRGLNTYSASERSKRRAATVQEPTGFRAQVAQFEARQHKSEGPLSAANAAAAAVPDPQLGLASLRQLHFFKSLYRRHYMIRQSWTNGKVRPSHLAFAAHPRHVITCLQFDDDKIITGSDDTLIHIYDTKTGVLRKRLEGHEGGVWALQYEGNILVSGSTDRSVRVWDIERGLCQQVFYGHTSTVRCLQIIMPTQTGKGPGGRAVMQPEKPLIITGSRDSQLRVWRLPEVGSRRYIQTHPPAQESECPYFIRVLSGHTHSVRAISAHGDTLVSGSYDSTVRVWRISTGDALHVLCGHAQKVYSVVFDPNRNRCVSGSMDSLVKIWDLDTGTCLHSLEGHNLRVGLLDLRDERLVSAAADSTLRIWDPESGRCRHTLMAHTGAITCFQHDGRKVISGSEKTVKMWDVRTGECVQDLLTDLSGVWQVKFDGRRCVAAVQRDQLTYVEVLDFGAIRDGRPAEELGKRILVNEHEVREITEDAMA